MCVMCDGVLSPPFVLWACCSGNIHICGRCCEGHQGLMADFVQVSAIRSLQSLGYGQMTLKRASRSSVDAEELAERTEGLAEGRS